MTVDATDEAHVQKDDPDRCRAIRQFGWIERERGHWPRTEISPDERRRLGLGVCLERTSSLLVQHALPVMEPGDAIVFISSVGAVLPTDYPAYTASKAALAGLNVCVAKEAAPKGIRVNLVLPGLIGTPLGRLATRIRPGRG
jgi:hypothetical protein